MASVRVVSEAGADCDVTQLGLAVSRQVNFAMVAIGNVWKPLGSNRSNTPSLDLCFSRGRWQQPYHIIPISADATGKHCKTSKIFDV